MSVAAEPFQTCGGCKQAWPAWNGFVLDPGVRLLGLQFHEGAPEVNLLVFEHDCGTTVSVFARRLRHLLPEPSAEEAATNLRGTDECRGHCRRLGDVEACDAPCSNARDRQLMRLLLRMKREGNAPKDISG